MRTPRGISTVADVSLALVLVVAAMGVLVAFGEADTADHEPSTADHTAQTLAASTINTSYTVTAAIEAHYRIHRADSNPYDEEDLKRISHGPVATQVADSAVATVTIDGQRLWQGARTYERALDEQLEARLVGSQFRTAISAYWTPLPGVEISGESTVGRIPPPAADVSTTTITVPSGIPEARGEAIDAIAGKQDYEAVAEAVANATVAGYFPEHESRLALERTGVDTLLTRYRYRRMATVLDGDDSRFEANDWLSAASVDAAAANEYLSRRLATEIERQLAAMHGGRYESAEQAARAVSTGYVTITIKTWTHD